MKVGTDGVLIGVWCTIPSNTKSILDVGCGSGLIAIMLGQRTEAINSAITAIDIDPNSCQQAINNARQTEWGNRISIENISLQDFCKTSNSKFDLIVSNPPFFVDSLKAPDKTRNNSRHCDTLTHEELLKCASRMLNDRGVLSVILPSAEAQQFVQISPIYGMIPNRICKVGSSARKRDIRRMVELVKTSEIISCLNSELLIHEGSDYSEEYKNLTHDFYLRF